MLSKEAKKYRKIRHTSKMLNFAASKPGSAPETVENCQHCHHCVLSKNSNATTPFYKTLPLICMFNQNKK